MGGKSSKILVCCFLLLAACTKDKPADRNTTLPTNKTGVYVVCEGNYGTGNTAGLYLLQPTTDSVFGDLYLNANGQYLGDVFQSMTKIGNRYFLVANNSNLIVTIDPGTYKQTGSLGILQPRNIVPVNDSEAFVSEIYRNYLYLINTTTLKIKDSIVLPSKSPEGMLVSNNTLYVSSWDSTNRNIYSIDIISKKITGIFRTGGIAPNTILMDANQLLWALSSIPIKGSVAALTQMDPVTGAVMKTLTFPVGAYPIKPAFNAAKDTLYFIEANEYGGTNNNGVYKIGINETQIPAQPFIQATAPHYFYALGLEPGTGRIYVGDPRNFLESGWVYIYESNGAKRDSFKVGFGPGQFVFNP